MNKVTSIWNYFFYQKSSPTNLGLTRIFFFLFIALYSYFFDQFSRTWVTLPQELWHPVWPLSLFSSSPLDSEVQYVVLFHLFIVLCLCCALGLFTRTSQLLCALLGTFLYALRVSFLEGSHDNLGTVLFLWAFAFTRSGDAYSLDQLMTKRSWPASSNYTWPLKLMQILFASIYFSAALSKIGNAGMAWIWGDTVKNYFLFSHYKTDLDHLGLTLGLGKLIAQSSFLSKLSGALTVLIELATVLCPFNKKARYLFIPLMFTWHIGFYFTSSNGFMNMTALFFCWVNWEKLIKNWPFIQKKKAV